MLPPHLRAILKHIDETIDKTDRGADDRSKRADDLQKAVVGAIQSFVDEFKSYQAKQDGAEESKLRRENWTIGALVVTAVVTVALAGVAWLQWGTLEKTDHTLRAGQRAFVFVKQGAWTTGKKVGDEVNRSLAVVWENNGNSQTRDMRVSLWCPRPSAFETVDPITSGRSPEISNVNRLLGPKQSVWGGVCHYSTTELENIRSKRLPWFVAAKATYFDIFGEPHVTEYCSTILNLEGDFRDPNVVPTNDAVGCDAHNCADDECKNPNEK
jgi:hypothetical protein